MPAVHLPEGPRATTAALTLAVFALHLWLARHIPGPSVILDEAGYLGNARWLAGQHPVFEMPVSPSYGFGYSLLLVPLQWVTTEPIWLWRGVLVVNAILLSALIPLLAALGRRVLGLTANAALVAAAVGSLVPAATSGGVSALSENLALPLVVATALALHRALQPGHLLRRCWFGPFVALLYASHPRFTTLVGVAVVALAVIGWRRMAPRAVVAANLVALLGLTVATRVVQARLIDARWSQVDSLEGGSGDAWMLLTGSSGLRGLATSALGQGWYLAASGLGLSVLGVGLVGSMAAGREPGVIAPASGPGRTTAAVLLAGAIGVFVTSVYFFTQTQFRADHLVYGRHNDSYAPVWAAAGMALLLRLRSGAALGRWLLAAAGVLVVLSIGVVLLVDPTIYGGTFAYFAVPGISRAIGDPASGTYLRASAMAAAGLALIAAMAWGLRRPRLLAVPLVVWFAWSGIGRIQDVESFAGATYRDWHLPAQVEALDLGSADLDADATRGATVLSYQFWMPEVTFHIYEPKLGERAEGPYVFAPLEDVGLPPRGARLALIDDGGFYEFRGTPAGMALWVLPGPEQDDLAARGLLLPDGFPTVLPTRARRGRLEILDRPDQVQVVSGQRVQLTVSGRHLGRGSPWPDRSSYRGEQRVRITADIVPLEPAGVLGAPSGGELPAWIRPGEGFTTTVDIFALGQVLQPLPPGRYRVTLGIGQPDGGWFVGSGPATTFTMLVTPP